MLTLAGGLAGLGLGVDLVLQRADRCHLTEIADGIRIIDLKAGRMAFALLPLASYLRRERPASLLSAMTHANVVALLARRLARANTRVVISEHNTLSEYTRDAGSWRDRRLPAIAKPVYRWADTIVAVSEGAADDLASTLGLPRKGIEVIYNPVVTPALLEKARDTVDHRWFQPGQPPVVLGVGRLTSQKDFATLVRAFACVRGEREVRLVILGDGEDRGMIDALAEELGVAEDVQMPGFVENPYKYMARAAVFALSSRYEGLPTVLIEALACGTRVVSTDCANGPREILRGGEYGELVPVGDADALAGAILSVLTGDPPAPNLRTDALIPFMPDTPVTKYARLMRGLAGE